MYSWACLTIPAQSGRRWVLVRRNDSTGELAYYLTYSPHPVPLRTLVRVAGQRWRVEESFQTGKGLTGLDEHQVRRWASWHRWVTLAMLAHAFLTVITAAERTTIPTPEGMIPITVNEQRRLIDALILRPHRSLDRLPHWSTWRRRHQATARQCHYRRRDESGAPSTMRSTAGSTIGGPSGAGAPVDSTLGVPGSAPCSVATGGMDRQSCEAPGGCRRGESAPAFTSRVPPDSTHPEVTASRESMTCLMNH